MSKYQFNDDMNEISGFGGEYEACCRRMLAAGLEWLDAHPEADPQFHGYKNIYGVIVEDNADAKALSEAVIAGAGEFGPSGAMHQAVVSSALWIRTNGWGAYVSQMTHPEGKAGILKEKLTRKTEDYDRLSRRFEELTAESSKRGSIIAERVLGWRRHKVSNGEQEAYAPSQTAAREDIGPGCQLSKLVDEAIAAMEPQGEAACQP